MKRCKSPKRVKGRTSAAPNPSDSLALAHSAMLRSALDLHHKGRLGEAGALYKQILRSQPGHFDALQLLAAIYAQTKQYEDAVSLFDLALKINPDHPTVLNNRGNALKDIRRHEDALVSYEKAIALKPDYAEPYYNRGNTLKEISRYEDALLSYEKAIALKPDYLDAYINCGNAFLELKRYNEALFSYEKALALKPDSAKNHYNRGNALNGLKRYEAALLSYEKALELNSSYAEVYYNKGNILQVLNRFREALLCYEKASALNPDIDYLLGERLHTKMRICDWSGFDHLLHQLAVKIECNEKVTTPFPVLALSDSPALKKKVAEIFVKDKYPFSDSFPEIPKRVRHDKIRIGYYSADYHNHATAYLMAELFELHDRSMFELIAFSFGSEKYDGMRNRVFASFDRFIDVRTKSDKEVVELSREMDVDIAVDLKGFTTDSRTGIFALRAAPIQVNYLGYPGSMGAEYIDYLIADSALIPVHNQKYYTEKIVYLPDTYQVNDSKRLISDRLFTREELDLPETGFVFCCFNNNYKIHPSTFDGWMRILKQVEGSILWLYEDNPAASDNLRREAVQRGVERERLIFAKRMPLPMHLARHRQADLFIDTLPCNAHTTASDALWAGLPVLTLTVQSFAGRVGSSLLSAIQLPELITSTQEEYEALAVELATHPEKLRQIRRKLEQNRLTTPLFDTQLFTDHIEEAYRMMYERYQAALPLDHIHIKPCKAVGKSRPKRMPLKDRTVSAQEDAQSVALAQTAMADHAAIGIGLPSEGLS